MEDNPMTDNVDTGSDNKHREPGPMYEASRRILLAAIGAVAFAQDEVEDFVNRLVERGEIAEKDGKQLIKEMLDKRNEKRRTIDGEVNKRFHDTLDRLNIPSKKDIEELSVKISELTRKVEELKKSKE
jgi:poly(hydroxyalkanoate) granule-associated protein